MISKSAMRIFVIGVAVICGVIMLLARAYRDAAIAVPAIPALGLLGVELFWREEGEQE